MNKIALTLVCCAAIAACSSSDPADTSASLIGGGSGTAPPDNGNGENGDAAPPLAVPAPIQSGTNEERTGGNVLSMNYDADAGILTIRGDPFDFAGDFTRSEGEDVDGFMAFRSLTGVDESERLYLALFGRDDDNGVEAAVVATPFRLETTFGGTHIRRDAVPDLPVDVQMTHRGEYAGVRTAGERPTQIAQGRATLYLDFYEDIAPGGIEGLIHDRRIVETGEELQEIVLVFTGLDEEGNFTGVALDRPDGNLGAYDGFIAGEDAAAAGGVLVINTEGAFERGAFLTRRD